MLDRTETCTLPSIRRKNMRVTTKRHSWNTGVHAETRYEVTSILKEKDKVYELGVHEWDWVHERLFMPEGAARGHKKCSCTQSHYEPRSYISLWWTVLHTPLFCRFIPLIFQKYTKNHHLYCHFPHLKVPVKLVTCLECTIQNRGVRCTCTYAWAHNKY